ncbi:MAG TPA: nitroreductase family protein [Terriglobales bacterium]|nr:nitroreductase family protein [Terriglobales bacterium]
MEFLDVLKKRRATRDFSEKPIQEETLWNLAHAARRAPTGGNTPYRRIMVVNDMKTIRLIKQVSPGIQGNPTALMVVFTDLEVTKELGRLGDVCATIDAGAAAENVTLAATDMGLGSCFTKSYSEIGVKEILNIPETCRTEIMLQLGYVGEEQSRPTKARKGADAVHLNRFGRIWDYKWKNE